MDRIATTTLAIVATLAPVASAAAAAGVTVVADPAEAVETWVRLKGDSAGAVTYEWVTGAAWGIPDGAMAQPLFRFESVTVRRFRKLGPAQYLEVSYACRLYRDFATGAFIDRLANPFTKGEARLETRCSPGPTVRYTPQKVALEPDIGFDSTALNVPMRLERVDMGERVAFRRDSRAQYTSRATGEQRRETSLDSFVVDAAALANPALSSLPAAYQWTSVTQWMTDLGAGMPPGRMLWSINGRKFDRPGDLPADFRAALEKAVPDALTRRLE
jgi:hypothetical protein